MEGEAAGGWRGLADLVAAASAGHEATPLTHAMVRLVAAMVLGGLIGFERERKGRPAGLRTHMLISLASALFILVALEFTVARGVETDYLEVDPSRVMQAVTAGVAFLAAGSIIRAKGEVKGITTGASMWLSSAVGLACGVGFFQIALFVTLVAVFVLVVIRLFEPD